MARRSRDEWLRRGLDVLGDEGLAGLTIDRMAESLGVTKGSFYHHFKRMRDFESQLLTYWRDQYLSTAGQLPESADECLRLLDTLFEETFAAITPPEIPIRMWAAKQAYVRPFVEAVDTHRKRIVFEILSVVTGDPARAQMVADVLFTIAIGSITVVPQLPPARVAEMYRELKRLFRLGPSK